MGGRDERAADRAAWRERRRQSCRGRHAGQVLIYPELGGDQTARSYVEHAEAPLLGVGDIDFYRRVRSAPGQSLDDPTFSPLRDGDFSGLPPTFIITAECDPLSSDG